MTSYVHISEGTVEGIEYVTVLDEGGNPQAYEVPRADAERDFPEGDTPILFATFAADREREDGVLTETEDAILDTFVRAALWADLVGNDGEQVTSSPDPADVLAHASSWAAALKLVRDFLAELDPIPHVTGGGVRADARRIVHDDPAQAGHDLWLTMRRHGVGFWDRGYKVATGQFLTEIAQRLGSEDAQIEAQAPGADADAAYRDVTAEQPPVVLFYPM